MVSFGLAWVRAYPSVLQGRDWQVPLSVPVVATVRATRAWLGDAPAAAPPSGNSAPVAAAKSTAGSDNRRITLVGFMRAIPPVVLGGMLMQTPLCGSWPVL